MTREEAVEKLEEFAPMVVDDTREAIDMAIEALQAEPVVRCKDCDRGFRSPVCPIQSKGWTVNINKGTFFCAWGKRSKT